MNEKATGTIAESGVCPHCGQRLNRPLEQFLARLGITDEMIENLSHSMQNVDVEEYLNAAREYLKTAGEKVKSSTDRAARYTKENPGKVAAGVAVLAVGAGLLINAMSRDR